MPQDYYVYLLVDHDPDGRRPETIFYVGKGKNTRALHHILEYVRALEEGDVGRAEALQVKDEDSGERQLVHEKVRRIAAIRSAGREVRIDVLRGALTSSAAYDIESAAIDVLGIQNLANKVSGHEHFRAPAAAVNKMLAATDVDIDERALQVTISGAWGGASMAGLVDAVDPEVIWENARQSWSLGRERQLAVADAAATSTPVLLVAVSKGPRQLWGGIILGVWELAGVAPGAPRVQQLKGGGIREQPGWEFLRSEEETPRLGELRRKWLSVPRRSTTRGQVGPVGINL